MKLPSTLDFLAPSIVPGLLRVGRWTDGGYVIPYFAIASTDALVSFGINRDWSFEEGFHAINPRAAIHAYDHTVSLRMFRSQFYRGLLQWPLQQLPRAALGQRLWLWREFHAFFGSKARHFEERIVGREEREGEATLDKALRRLSPDRRKVFLKVDIEGDEYGIIEAILRHAARITAIAIEFHDTDRRRTVFCDAVSALQHEFEIVHLHANNCDRIDADGLPAVLEITFVRRSGRTLPKRQDLPIELDRPNNASRPDYPLHFDLQGFRPRVVGGADGIEPPTFAV